MLIKRMNHIFFILTCGDPVSTTIKTGLFILRLSSPEPAFASVASSIVPPCGPQKIILICFVWSFLIWYQVRARSRMMIREATKGSEGKDTNGIFSLYFSLKQSQWEGLGRTLVGLMIPLHQQTATQTISGWLCTAVSKPETRITGSKYLLTARFHGTFPCCVSQPPFHLPSQRSFCEAGSFPFSCPKQVPPECICSL